MPGQGLMPEETQKYLDSHPQVDAQLKRAEKVYKVFGDFLNLTQSRVVIRESSGSTSEADLSAALSRTNL